jgi:hypothetical protein
MGAVQQATLTFGNRVERLMAEDASAFIAEDGTLILLEDGD